MNPPQDIQPLATNSAELLNEIHHLLSACGLPTSDLRPSNSVSLFVHYSDEKPVGVIGLEVYGTTALLRSLAVAQTHRKHGLGRSLVKFAEAYAAKQNIESMYLLTATAGDFFSRLGYSIASREDAPPSIKATSQFSGLCPSSSTCMRKFICKTQ